MQRIEVLRNLGVPQFPPLKENEVAEVDDKTGDLLVGLGLANLLMAIPPPPKLIPIASAKVIESPKPLVPEPEPVVEKSVEPAKVAEPKPPLADKFEAAKSTTRYLKRSSKTNS